jgi:hypothetical protein
MLDLASDDNDEAGLTYDQLTTKRLDVKGAVHSSGEVVVNIGRLFTEGSEGATGLHEDGSVHETGYAEVNVEEENELPEEAFPEPDETGSGFTNTVAEDIRESFGGEGIVHIKKAYLVPTPSPRLINALGHRGHLYREEVSIRGNVHSPGMLTVNIDDMYVYGGD